MGSYGKKLQENTMAPGALMGATLAAAGTLAARARRRAPEEPGVPDVPRGPPRMPHPHFPGWGIHGGAGAPAA